MHFKNKIIDRALSKPLVLAVILLLAWTTTAAARSPLLLPGKRTLYQRVVTHPGARLYSGPGKIAGDSLAPIKPFSVNYVYDRKTVKDVSWLEVGISSVGGTEGWIRGDRASDWKQALTLVFTERTGRRPVLFFKDLAALENLAASEDPGASAEGISETFAEIREGKVERPEEFPASAMEPGEEAVSRERFYLIPIFQAMEIFEGVKFLEVASIDPGTGWTPGDDAELRTAIVFVIDATISMKPYIHRTREAVRKIQDSIETAGLAEKVAFGLVAFRSSIDRTPELGYVSKVFSPLKDGSRRDEFETALADVKEAEASSHSFNEDAFAGVKTALEELDWTPYSSRVLFLITDAGAIRNDDPWSSTGMNEAEIADLAAAKGVKVFALHLKTEAGDRAHANNHAFAETQYRTLTRQSDRSIGDLYVPIDASRTEAGVEAFGDVVEGVASEMVELVWATAAGQRLALPEFSPVTEGDVTTTASHKAAVLGYAMQLDFLGRRGGIRAPEVVTAWVADMDLARPDTPAFQVCVLLTKNQLSDLHQRLKIILDEAQRTKRTGARDFFQSILSAAAQTSRDPTRFSRNPNQNLGQMGILAEFIEDLPYKSAIMRLTEEDWYRLSVGEQQALINSLKSKLRMYRQYHNDTENWESFGSAEPGDAVYRTPLSAMP